MKLFLGLCLLNFLCLETITSSLQYKITNIFSNCKISAEKSQKKENYPFGTILFFYFSGNLLLPYTYIQFTPHVAQRKPARSAASKEEPP